MIRLLRKQGAAPRRMVTDKLKSYAAAKRQVMPRVRHLSHKGLNNRVENSHLPLRKRERMLQRFRSPGTANGSWPCSPPSATCSFRLALSIPPSAVIPIGCGHSPTGTLRPHSPPEIPAVRDRPNVTRLT